VELLNDFVDDIAFSSPDAFQSSRPCPCCCVKFEAIHERTRFDMSGDWSEQCSYSCNQRFGESCHFGHHWSYKSHNLGSGPPNNNYCLSVYQSASSNDGSEDGESFVCRGSGQCSDLGQYPGGNLGDQ